MTMRRASLLAGLAGMTLLPASVLPAWVQAERVIVGYGSARVVWPQDAWSGFFVPWLPLGVVLAGLAGLLALATIRGPAAWVRGASVALALGSVTALLTVLATGRDTLTPTSATTWTGAPGWLVGVGIGTGILIAVTCLSTGGRLRDRPPTPLAVTLLMLALIATACSTGPGPAATASEAPSAGAIPDWRTDPDEPYPFTSPVPDLTTTVLDGEYTRPPTDSYTGDRAACRRCPPYPPDRGASILRFDRGRYEIVHEEPAYRTFGHFTVDGELLTLINDPECATDVGTYRVERDGAQLRFDVVDDLCAFGQRTRDLTARTWTPAEIARGESCQPPNTEAAISGHWPEPSGC